jgi:hypothetical protein
MSKIPMILLCCNRDLTLQKVSLELIFQDGDIHFRWHRVELIKRKNFFQQVVPLRRAPLGHGTQLCARHTAEIHEAPEIVQHRRFASVKERINFCLYYGCRTLPRWTRKLYAVGLAS